MCTTCGCGVTEEITIQKPGEMESPVSEMPVDHHIGHEHHDHHEHHGHEHGQEHDHHHHHQHEKTILEVEQDILQSNQLLAERNRGYFLGKNIFAINLVSSPGSGKTTLLERTLTDLKSEISFYVIEGDQQTMNDANRIDTLQIPVVQINTGTACHLDSNMVSNAVLKLNPKPNAIVMIENVGNLVCPAAFDLGENVRVVIISTTEGDDKPIKYPDMFFGSQVCIINKIDLLPYVNFDIEKTKEFARQVNPNIEFFEISSTTGEGMDKWYEWLKNKIK